MNLTLNAVKNSAFLANKTYKDKAKLDKDAKNNGGTITNPATNSSFEVYNQADNDSSGFSATVFRNPPKGLRDDIVGNSRIP